MFFIKYACVNLFADAKSKTLCYIFIGTVNESKSKPNKIWVNQEGDFYNNCMKSGLVIMVF